MTRCKTCVLPISYQGVRFDDSGVCDLCRDYKEAKQRDDHALSGQKEQLKRMADDARRKGGTYDCIVPVSGGRDSSYAAYVMRRILGLRVLGVNFDNGYRSDLAIKNLEALSQTLEMNIVSLKLDAHLVDEIFAHFLRNIGYICSACDAMGYIVVCSFIMRETSRTGRGPLVIGGWSRKHEYQPGLSVLSMKDFGKTLALDKSLFEALRLNPLVEKDVFDKFIQLGDIRQLLPKPSNGEVSDTSHPRVIQLPDYWEWDYRAIDAVLKNEVGWQNPGGIDTAHFDCRLSAIPEYLKKRKFGFSQETIRLSALIREGLVSREEALKKIERECEEAPPVLVEALDKWGMSPEEIAWQAEWSR